MQSVYPLGEVTCTAAGGNGADGSCNSVDGDICWPVQEITAWGARGRGGTARRGMEKGLISERRSLIKIMNFHKDWAREDSALSKFNKESKGVAQWTRFELAVCCVENTGVWKKMEGAGQIKGSW